ncbi:MAG: CDP-alcohol phosphatidyltransferase family protein [Acidimicrobiia bacterium]|nr:CDP-alcohol phosphatidyltransferase family protein [Acidimicrobiia bacterium]
MLTIPNLISFTRLLLVPLFLWLLFGRDNVAGAGWLLGFIGATDWVDGYLARRLNQVSKVGEFLDPLADRLAVVAAVIGGLIYGVLPPWFAWGIIVREGLIAVGALVIGVKAGSKLTVRRMGKLATLMLYAGIAWLYVGIGSDATWLEWLAWIVGVPGLILYWVVGFQYFADARRIVAEQE